ncbi:small redox-active disulfide protein 2 [Mariniphaga anaerophila]|uniref:Small redox-active disulfide protein 2 n=1 Tax=Mariniphaga anaerophila TaxID=1484053 RepID=A0A1M5EN58_9BACT|nr:thioredoxin family protein [Mariniphaga anaerophila]SHF80616.1 small redox-active disulfide protein 2 [Mariniphaga anaerophila]
MDYKDLKPGKMELLVLGTGCPKCKALDKAVNELVAELDLQANVRKVEDIMEIMQFGVMRTPALVVNGKVVVSGRIPNKTELTSFLTR